jgi:hypothetical protein
VNIEDTLFDTVVVVVVVQGEQLIEMVEGEVVVGVHVNQLDNNEPFDDDPFDEFVLDMEQLFDRIVVVVVVEYEERMQQQHSLYIHYDLSGVNCCCYCFVVVDIYCWDEWTLLPSYSLPFQSDHLSDLDIHYYLASFHKKFVQIDHLLLLVVELVVMLMMRQCLKIAELLL